MPEEVKKVELNSDTVEKLIDQVIPKSAQERLAQMLEDMEPQHRLHPDKVAVYEVSMATLPSVDGTPGWYDIVTGSDESKALGLSTTQERTEQDLVISDRYEVVMRIIPESVWMHTYTIVDRKEWEEQERASARGMMTNAQQMAGIMQRSNE